MAAKTHQPYQKIVLVPRGDAIESSFLLAASGSTLTSISLRQGSIVSQWPEAPAIANEAGRLASRSTQTNNEIQGEKAEQDQEQAQEPEPDQKQDAGKKEPEPSLKRKRGNEPAPAGPPSISHVALAPSGEHVVVATLQDKTLRVLSLSAEGILTHLTAGAMPKRLSALAFTPSGATVLAADKTGEVYGLPLLPAAAATPSEMAEETRARSEALSRHAPLAARTVAGGPEASHATVHSERNRRALQEQLRVVAEGRSQGKDGGGGGGGAEGGAAGRYELLLGHVSIVTDILCAPHPEPGRESRAYIITADRDEHIRVSRAPPQSHVTEGFCLGHAAFVSRLCLASPDVLASAGGDDEVFAWRWCGEGGGAAPLVGKVGIRGAVEEVRGEGREGEGVAVAGMWRFEQAGQEARMVLAVEGVPALFHLPVSALTHPDPDAPSPVSYLSLPGNPLDVACCGDSILVSLDNIHAPGSTSELDDGKEARARLVAVRLDGAPDAASRRLEACMAGANGLATGPWDEREMGELLYGVEKMRKYDAEGQEDEKEE